jgi:hypothetical protein
MVVGTGCMGLGPEVQRRFAAKATKVAKLQAEREMLLDQITAHETATREVAAMTPPPPVPATTPWGAGVEVGGEFAATENRGQRQQAYESAVAEAQYQWRRTMVREILGIGIGSPDIWALRHRLAAVERRLAAAD